MGTASEWLSIVGFGAFFTAFMLLVSVSGIPKVFAFHRFPRLSKLLNICALILGSVSIGMVHEFEWKALFRGKLGGIFVLATLTTVAFGLSARRLRKSEDIP
jgi:hypothetical protein